MGFMNTLDRFLEERGVNTAYRFAMDTGLPEATARRLLKDRSVYPNKESLIKICKAYKAKPGEFLDFDFNEAA